MTTTQDSAPSQLPHFSLVIDGQPAEPASGRRYESIDPFSGAAWATAADGGEADVNLAVAAARRAAATAASTSAASPSAALAHAAPRNGSTDSYRRPDAASVRRPSMNSVYRGIPSRYPGSR